MDFLCSKCGACCLVAGKRGMPDRGDGACVYLDKNNLCSIYDKRPIECRVKESGENIKKNNPGFSIKDYYKLNTLACHQLIDEQGLDKKYKIDIKEYDDV